MAGDAKWVRGMRGGRRATGAAPGLLALSVAMGGCLLGGRRSREAPFKGYGTPVFSSRAMARMAEEARHGASVLSVLPVPGGGSGVRARLRLRVHQVGTHVSDRSNSVERGYFSRLPGQRAAYVSTGGPGAVHHYDLSDVGANPRPRAGGPRNRLMYGDLPRGTVGFEGMLTDVRRGTEVPLVVTAEHANARRAEVLLERLLPTPTGGHAPSPIDPRPRNAKYQSASVGDFNGDALPDLVAFNVTPVTNRGPVRLVTTLYFYQGGGDGQFRFVNQLELDRHYADDVRVVDLDGDGRDELVMLNGCTVRGGYVMFCTPPDNPGDPRGSGVVVVDHAEGRLRARPTLWFDRSFVGEPLVIADLDGDGRRDIASGVNEVRSEGNFRVDQMLVYLAQPDGTFTERRLANIPRTDWQSHADLDGDGRAEIVDVSWNQVTVWSYRDGALTRQPVELDLVTPDARGRMAGLITDRYDFDHDGDEDLLVAGISIGRPRGAAGDPGPMTAECPVWVLENVTEQAPRRGAIPAR
jgi:hypothetical protein